MSDKKAFEAMNLFVHNMKNSLKSSLLRLCNIERIHIVGCSRSGTTMLHYALNSFDNTIIYDKEVSVWNYPELKEIGIISCKYLFDKEKYYLVTKRGRNWFNKDHIYRLIEYTIKYNLFIINIIRDPRDVLTSKHPLRERKFYVEPDMWEESIHGCEILMKNLEGYTKKVSIKYEDVVLNPSLIERILFEKIGLQLREGIESWSMLKDNIELLGNLKRMIPYMHKLRNFDPSSIGKWKHETEKNEFIEYLLNESEHKKEILRFMDMHGYN